MGATYWTIRQEAEQPSTHRKKHIHQLKNLQIWNKKKELCNQISEKVE